jgi:prepilin-type N-terminal cleavage/methylation domain-containing protein
MRGAENKSCMMSRRAGFTLIELMVVITVIGIMASILLVALRGFKDKALNRQAESEVRALALAVRAYHAEIGDWPIPASANPNSGGVWSNKNYEVFGLLLRQQNLRRNYLEMTNLTSVLRDPFKSQVSYVVTIDVTNNSVQVKSAGKDGVLGSGDDISAQY